MEQITGTLTQDTNFNLLYPPCSKICTLSFPLTYVMFTLPGELNFNIYAIPCSCVTQQRCEYNNDRVARSFSWTD